MRASDDRPPEARYLFVWEEVWVPFAVNSLDGLRIPVDVGLN
jgi:hypothetical protein